MPNSEDKVLPGGPADREGEAGSIRHEDCIPSPEDLSGPLFPPRLVSFAELLQTANGVSNLSLAHEIVMDSSFQLKRDSPPENSLHQVVKKIVHRAFWDSLQTQLSATPPDYSHAIKLLQEIKEALLSLLMPGHHRLRTQINEALDVELIRQQAEHNALDIPRLSRFIVSTMGTLCAPVRDEEVKKLKGVSDPVQLFRDIFQVLDLMKMDMANFTIQSLRPHLQQQYIQYERCKFQEFLNKQPDTLNNTIDWLRRAAADIAASVAPSNQTSDVTNGKVPIPESPGTSDKSPTVLSPTLVLSHAYMNLLKWDIDSETYPETVLLDRVRMQELQTQLKKLTFVASVLLVTSNLVGAALFSISGFVDKLKQIITVLLDGIHCSCFKLDEALLAVGDQVHLEVTRALLKHGYTALSDDQEASLKGQIRGIAQEDNLVRKIIDERTYSYLKNSLCASDLVKHVAAVPRGLAPVQAELKEIGAKFAHVVHRNRLVFGLYYSGILKKVLLPEAEPEAGVDSR
uniref:T-complex 11 n=1 Tax=Latimeria chalumnae TaxID=7897 RepID=H3B4B6_LATCH